MSIHTKGIGEAVIGLLHLHHPEEPRLSNDQRLLIEA